MPCKCKACDAGRLPGKELGRKFRLDADTEGARQKWKTIVKRAEKIVWA